MTILLYMVPCLQVLQLPGHPPDRAVVDPVHLGDAGDRLPLAELALHLLARLGGEHRGTADPLPLGPGPLLALDAALPDVAPLLIGNMA